MGAGDGPLLASKGQVRAANGAGRERRSVHSILPYLHHSSEPFAVNLALYFYLNQGARLDSSAGTPQGASSPGHADNSRSDLHWVFPIPLIFSSTRPDPIYASHRVT